MASGNQYGIFPPEQQATDGGYSEAYVEQLRAELDKATRLVGQSIQWQHDAETKLLKLEAERDKLKATLMGLIDATDLALNEAGEAIWKNSRSKRKK